MDQTPKSTDQRRTDHNNNTPSACSCTNISIMQLFHEMKQEFPKVPDHIVHQLATDNCHNRRVCIDQLRQVATTTSQTPTMYPSKSIHSNNQQTPRSPINGVKWANNKKMREISEMFENSSISCSSSSEASTTSIDCKKAKRPTTLHLRRAPDPPSSSKSTPSSSSSNTNLSKLTSTASSTSSLLASTTSVSSISSSNQHNQVEQYQNQFHHNVTLDSSAAKYNDSLNVQLNVTVSPISGSPPIPPRPTRHTSLLNVQPEPPYTNMVDAKNSSSPAGATSACTGSTGQRSYTSVNFTLRQPTSILPSPQAPIDIQAGPSSLTYSSSSFDAKQGYQSHLKITVAGNGESCIQAVRTKQQPTLLGIQPEIGQIDTTINIGGVNNNEHPPIRITSNPHNQSVLPQITNHLTEEELRKLIQKQLKQKEVLECELMKEREKLEMIRFDIVTLSSPMMSGAELQQLCGEISRLRVVCERLSDEVDDETSTPQRSPVSITSNNRPSPQRPPPPIPAALRCLSLQQNPFHSQLPLETSRLQLPPSYNDVMRETGRLADSNGRPNRIDINNDDDDQLWPCNMCTFLNNPLLNQCEECEMPRRQQAFQTEDILLLLSTNQNKIIHSWIL